MHGFASLQAAEAFIATEGVEFVRFEQLDAHGIARSKTPPARHFGRFAREDLNFPLLPSALARLARSIRLPVDLI
ncbi:hypothetical protein MPL1032_130116 [Mesorhizobium plurifarium]|uniref:Uncharacterized protein n=1 Tax=Mesorhizobium plurifarium TaxID=69974 RepID=A0A0K2VQC2_MESPL|nr:hypothetical protein MPL1032_130116 [Mesorhizobium plurifarium]